MPDFQPGVQQQQTGYREELRRQKVDIKNILPFDIYEGLVCASRIQADVVQKDTIDKRHIKDFYENFWHIYHYVKNAVEAEKLSPGLTKPIDAWFKMMRRQYRNTELILIGVDLYVIFVKHMQMWGIGRLFEKSIDPPFMIEDMDDFDLLIEEVDEEVVAQATGV